MKFGGGRKKNDWDPANEVLFRATVASRDKMLNTI